MSMYDFRCNKCKQEYADEIIEEADDVKPEELEISGDTDDDTEEVVNLENETDEETEVDDYPYYFTITMSMKEYDLTKVSCPKCEGNDIVRIYEPVTYTLGLTANEKRAGTTRTRLDSGKYMKDVRQKRKKTYGPNTYEGSSNELWTGAEVRDGYFPGPTGIKQAKDIK